MISHVKCDRDRPIATVTLARPDKRNAISREMMEHMIELLQNLGGDRTIKVTILQGEGGIFSAGWDREQLLDHTEPTRSRFVNTALRFYRALTGFPKPLIAAVEGYALGTAFDVSLLSDIRVCSRNATFAHPEVKLGGPCLYTPLKEVVGAGWARELCLSGRPMDAQMAEKIGFVNRVCDDGRAYDTARVLAAELCETPLETLVYTKSYLWTYPDPESWLHAELDVIMKEGMTIQR